jgi:hypothetical protein
MKERPILFSGAMVRAILEGRKTQTRRVVKPSRAYPFDFVGGGPKDGPDWNNPECWGFEHPDHGWWLLKGCAGESDIHQIPCPYGQIGDRLWVRETWSADFAGHYPHDRVWYAADDDRVHDIDVRDGVRGIYSPESDVHVPFRWRPSIHMPRWASRITLEVTGVRVERLQSISEADAIAEGCVVGPDRTARWDYILLWDSLNATRGYGWDVNPWVWVVEFARLP